MNHQLICKPHQASWPTIAGYLTKRLHVVGSQCLRSQILWTSTVQVPTHLCSSTLIFQTLTNSSLASSLLVTKQRGTQWKTLNSFQADLRILTIYAYALRRPHTWPLNAWTRTAMDVLNENKDRSRVYKARCYAKLKKEVSGNHFVNSCRTCLPGNGSMHVMTDCAATWLHEFFMPYPCIQVH